MNQFMRIAAKIFMWSSGIFLLSLLLVLLLSWLTIDKEIWQHLLQYTLNKVVVNTLLLCVLVACGVLIIGVLGAYACARFEFPGRKLFEIASFFPLAMPPYVMAFIVLGLYEVDGPVHQTLKWIVGQDISMLTVSGLIGLSFVLTIVLFPYVFWLTRLAFMAQSSATIEISQSLGLSPWQRFWRVSFPLARPAILAGLLLALMETITDFGAAATFNVDTFTTTIYKTWFSLFSIQSAAQLSSILLFIVIIVMFFVQRERQVALSRSDVHDIIKRTQLKSWHAWLITLLYGFFILITIGLPVAQLIIWVIDNWLLSFNERFLQFLLNSIELSSLAAVITVLFGLAVAFIRRFAISRESKIITFLLLIGYAFPGTVLAVAIMKLLNKTENILQSINLEIGLSYGLLALLLAYLIRFLRVAYNPIYTEIKKLTPSIMDASNTLTTSKWYKMRKLYWPVLRPGLLIAALLVFVEVMKEMPATLMLRPFGKDTLATRVFEMTSEGLWEQAALPALSIIIVGLIPVILLLKNLDPKSKSIDVI